MTDNIAEIPGVTRPTLPAWKPRFSEAEIADALKRSASAPASIATLNGQLHQLVTRVCKHDGNGIPAFDASAVSKLFNDMQRSISAQPYHVKLLLIEDANKYFNGLLEVRSEYEAALLRRAQAFAEIEQRRVYSVQRLVEFGQREGNALTAAIDRLQERLTILRGKLTPDGLAEWSDLLDDALASCRGSVIAALKTSPAGNVTIKSEAARDD